MHANKFISFILCMTGIAFASCNSSTIHEDLSTKSIQPPKEDIVFFPVTDFIKGEIQDVWKKNVKIKQYSKKEEFTDSSYLKNDSLSLNNYFSVFLEPVIDSVYTTRLCRVTKFMDETIGLITLMYERKKTTNSLPDWLGWNVYIKPETGVVEKIYLHKQKDSTHTQQLIWSHEKGCQIRTFGLNSSGVSELLDELRFIW